MTNLMAQWTLRYASDVAEWMRQQYPEEFSSLIKRIDLQPDELKGWAKMGQQIYVHQREDGVIEQFEGFFDLDFIDQSELEPRHQSLQSLFGIAGVQRYQFIKQPDVVMAMHLLSQQFRNEQVTINMDYYTPRTDLTHGSSLGPSIQALMLARMGKVEEAKALLIKTLLTDLENNRGNTPEGIHAASAGAVWQVVVMGFAGLQLEDGQPVFSKKIPADWKGVRFSLLWRQKKLGFDNF